MRVLLLHNRYRAQGGEERAVEELAGLLRRRGHEVHELQRGSDSLTRAAAARALLTGGEEANEVAHAVREHRIDVVHAHNLHPRFGWRALQAARGEGARTVLHLHNFRLFCSIGIGFRDGRPCHACRGRDTLPGLIHNCRGRRSESAVYTAALALQQPHLLHHADAICVLSRGHGELLGRHGLPPDRLHVVPNFVREFAAATEPEPAYALAAGRLVAEKGFDTAIEAAAGAGVPLVIVGAGPDEPRLRILAAAAGTEVRFTGWLASQPLAQARRRAAAVLVPSRCEEACPYAVLDALADGLPALVSDRGGLPEMVPAGAALPADDVEAWSHVLHALWSDRSRRRSLSEAAVENARSRFSEDAVYPALLRAYGCEP